MPRRPDPLRRAPRAAPPAAPPTAAGGGRFRLALVAGLLLATACNTHVEVPRVPGPAPGFERAPYLVAVGSDRATLAWVTAEAVAESVWVRLPAAPPRLVAESVLTRVHRIEIGGLPPATAVEYEIKGYGGGGSADATARFRTAPPRGSRAPFRFFGWGDSGSGADAQLAVWEQIEREDAARPFDLAIHTGDLAYPAGSERDLDLRYFGVYASLLARVPVYPAPGNHDLDTGGGRAFADAFLAPRGLRTGARYYSFDYANAHFVALDANPGERVRGHGGDLRSTASAQYRWLEADLRAAARDSAVNWIVVYTHQPPYNSAWRLVTHGSDLALRRALAPLFDRHGVDLVISGHQHRYERTFPLKGGMPDSTGTTYLVSGGGGGSIRFVVRGGARWSAVRAQKHHFVVFDVRGDTLAARAIDARGEALDTFVLTARRQRPR